MTTRKIAMEKYELLTELRGLTNIRVTHYQQEGPDRLVLFVESTMEVGVCPACQQVSVSVHDIGEAQRIRDLSMWNRRCWLKYAPRRFKCASCENTFVERVVWRESGLNYTVVRYEQAIYGQA